MRPYHYSYIIKVGEKNQDRAMRPLVIKANRFHS